MIRQDVIIDLVEIVFRVFDLPSQLEMATDIAVGNKQNINGEQKQSSYV